MCYQKKYLRNKVLPEHLSGFDKVWIKAPCGCCPSCRKVRSNDWFVRGFFEFEDNNRQAFFVTLTFDDEHLPRWHGKPCFDSEIIKGFFKRLRYYVGRFRYLYSTEYGGFLKRPHYHVIFLPEEYVSEFSFFSSVCKCWDCGTQVKIDSLPSVKGNKLKALQYVTSYTTKDITWTPQEFEEFRDMPKRYRPRTQASKRFGFSALEDGRITYDMILNGERISLPVGKNGKLVLFAIPRYYEMKVGYDYVWHPESMKAELIKNQFGVEIAKASHNGKYVYYIKQFFSSRHNSLEPVVPGLDWYHTVLDCLDNLDDFKEFVYYRPFISRWDDPFIFDNIRNVWLFRPDWIYYNRCCSHFDNFMKEIDLSKYEIENDKLIQSAKYRARSKLARDTQLKEYLHRKHYDFSQIY